VFARWAHRFCGPGDTGAATTGAVSPRVRGRHAACASRTPAARIVQASHGGMKRILYIGGGREAEETLGRARELGLEIIHIQHQQLFNPAVLPYVDHVILVDYEDLDILIPLAKTLYSVLPFARVMSLSEDALLPVAHVRDALGLPGNSLATVTLLKDK